MASGTTYDFTSFQNHIFSGWSEQFRSGPGTGEYSWAVNGPTSLYGTTDLVFCKAIMGDLDLTENEKDEWAAVINRFQYPDTGWYWKTYTNTHYREHYTAYAVAALHLLERKPAHPMKWAEEILKSPKHWKRWSRMNPAVWNEIWTGSQRICGPPAVFAMLGLAGDDFFAWYFDWLDATVDPETGFWRRGIYRKFTPLKKLLEHFFKRSAELHEMAGAFHMYFIYEYLGREWKYPEKIIDTTLELQSKNGCWDTCGPYTYCIDLDGVYNMLRSSRNAGGYRSDDIKEAVKKYLDTAEQMFNDRNFVYENYDNTHELTGALAAIAECQNFYPDMVKTVKPWTQTLDRACFI